MNRNTSTILVSTLLSERPHPNAKRVTLISLLCMMIPTLFFWENVFSSQLYLDAVPRKVFQDKEYWRVFTAMFVHSDASHFLGNAVSFTGLAFLLYGYFGFWVFPVYSLCLGAIANALSLLTYPPETHLLGMSGAIYVMSALWLTLYFFLDRRFSIPGRLLRTLGFALVVLIPSNVSPHVSYRTHAIGFALGLVFGCIYFFFNKSSLRKSERFEIEEVEDLETELPN